MKQRSLPPCFNKKQEKLTLAGLSYILNKYIVVAKIKYPDFFQEKVSPHVLRHSNGVLPDEILTKKDKEDLLIWLKEFI